jgi:hypothetical protein
MGCSLVPAPTGTRPVKLGFPLMCVVDLVKLSCKLDASHNNAEKATWQASSAYVQLESQLAWFSQLMTAGNKTSHSLAILTLWSIWKQRNAVVFRGCRKGEQTPFSDLKDLCQQCSLAGGSFLKPLVVQNSSV